MLSDHRRCREPSVPGASQGSNTHPIAAFVAEIAVPSKSDGKFQHPPECRNPMLFTAFRAAHPKFHPHDSAKTQRKAKSLRQKPGKGCLAGPVCGSPRGKGKEGRNSFRCICTNQKLARDCLFCGRLQRHPRARMPQNDHCAVQIQADVCFRWRLLRWRRLSALGNAAP